MSDAVSAPESAKSRVVRIAIKDSRRRKNMQVIDETPADIRRLVEGDFGPFDETRDFNLVFLDWLHYRARRIWQHPRKVVASSVVLGLAKVAADDELIMR
jgi:hypothetical protein